MEQTGIDAAEIESTLSTLEENNKVESKAFADVRVWWSIPEAKVETAGSEINDELLEAIFEKAIDAILVADNDGTYIDVNQAACELFGLSRNELIGRSIEDFAAVEYDFDRAWSEFHRDSVKTGNFLLQRIDGEERVVEFAATSNILPGIHLSIIRDVTEFQETRAELERTGTGGPIHQFDEK